MSRKTIYAIDFDGTIVSNEFPFIGDINKEVQDLIYAIQERGDEWILYTMREDEVLDEALEYCKEHGLFPNAVNDNTESMKRLFRNNPRKVYADYYIDDHNAGGLRLP